MAKGKTGVRKNGWVKMDPAPVGEIMEKIKRLNSHQREYLLSTFAQTPGFMRTQMGAWGYLFEDPVKKELPKDLRPRVERFWKAVDRVCMREDRLIREGKRGLGKTDIADHGSW